MLSSSGLPSSAPPSSRLPPPSGPPAGWYPDPSGAGQRYFDGRGWAAPTAAVWLPATRPPRPPEPALRLSDAVIALVVLAASLTVNRLVTLPSVAGALVGYGPSLAWAGYVVLRERRRGSPALGFRFRWSDLGWGPATWFAAFVVEICVAIVILITGIPLTSNVEEIDRSDITPGLVISMIAIAVIAAPLIEEVVFRGIVMRGLTRPLTIYGAVPVQGVLFGCAHIDPSRGWGNVGLVIVLSMVGCVFGAAAAWKQRLGPAIVAHAIFNGVVTAIVLSGAAEGLE